MRVHGGFRGLVQSTALVALMGMFWFVLATGPAGAEPPANDNFADAEVLSGLPTSTAGQNIDATFEDGEPTHSGPSVGSIWYSWTAPSSGPVAVDLTKSYFDTYLAVYTGDTLGSLSLVAENDDIPFNTWVMSQVVFSAVSGETYRIQVDGDNFGGNPNIPLEIFVPGSISGTVTDSSDTSLEKICVTAYDAGGDQIGAGETDSSGDYTTNALATGDYRLEFQDCRRGYGVVDEFYNDKQTLAEAETVAVVGGSDTPGIDVTMDPLGPTPTVPTVTIDSGPGATTSDPTPTFAFSASEAATFECRLYGQGSPAPVFTACSGPGQTHTPASALGNGDYTFDVRATNESLNSGTATSNFTVQAEARISKVSVKGPKKIKKGKKATYKVKITNPGGINATGVKLQIKGKGVKAKKSVGKVAAGKSKTVKFKLKPKKPGKIKLTFKATSSNAGSKSVKKKITVKK